MIINEFITYVQRVVEDATKLKDIYTDKKNITVGYACIFAQNNVEFEEFKTLSEQIGKIIKTTATGPVFQISPLSTVSGDLRVLKIRLPDPTRPERGDADFNIEDYTTFKNAFKDKVGFKIIHRDTFEMIELMIPDFDVRVYFSNPPVEIQLGITAEG
jgi:hypothetical protein